MINLDIPNLKSPVPKEIRLEVYKKAVRFIEKMGCEFPSGLCLLLPTLLWNDANFTPEGRRWYYKDTDKAFPEMSADFFAEVSTNVSKLRAKVRVKYLRMWIKQLESELKE